jgi:hypothetical protein
MKGQLEKGREMVLGSYKFKETNKTSGSRTNPIVKIPANITAILDDGGNAVLSI